MSVLIFFSVTGFTLLDLEAMRLYPGGTWWDATARGHRFWENFLCDLEWQVALDGQPNRLGSRFAQAGMLVLVLGFVPFWLAVPRLFAAFARAGTVVRVLGLLSVVGLLAVTFMPSERFGVLHGAAVVVAGVPGLTAAGVAIAALLGGEPRPRVAGWLGAGMLGFALVDFALYVSHLVGHVEGTPLVVKLEKIPLVLLLAWMVTVAARTGRLAS